MVERMFDVEGIPEGLDRMPPGPVLGALLAVIDPDRVSGHDRVVVLRALARLVSHLEARVLAAVSAVADHMGSVEFPGDPELSWHAAATEIGTALRLTRRAAAGCVELAVGVCRRLPRVGEALAGGVIDRPRARVLVDGTVHLDEATARRVVDAVIGDAPGLTTGQLAERLRRVCIQADPGSAQQRYGDAVEQRRVVAEASPDGTAHLMGLDLAPEQVAVITRRIDRLARSLGGDPRSIDQRRADVFCDLLSGRGVAVTGGVIDLRVDLDTLTGLTEHPGDLAGYGPVIADIARRVAESHPRAQWRYTVTDPDTGHPVATGTTRRRPTPAQRRSVQARHPTCIFPGCRMPATGCDLDHRTPWAQQHTTHADGLDPLCRYHHITARHHIGWTHQPLPNGDHLWTSPLGHHHTTSGTPP